MKKELFFCDIKGCGKEATLKNVDMQVVFETEQTEGRIVPKYLSAEKLDLCDRCMKNIISGNYVFGRGAMGSNEYWFNRVVE